MNDNSSVRIEFTNIRIEPDGKWFTGDKQIINENVIRYFRENLFRDNQGVYIMHRFRELAEKGYIMVNGPVDFVFRVEENAFLLLSGRTVPFSNARIFSDAHGRPYLFIKNLRLFAGFTNAVSSQLSQVIEEEDGDMVFLRNKIAVLDPFTFDYPESSTKRGENHENLP